MTMEWARRGVWVLAAGAWGLMGLDALPWGLDFDEPGVQGLIRAAAVVASAWLVVYRAHATPAEEIYQAGYDSGYDAGRRAAAERLRSGVESLDPRR